MKVDSGSSSSGEAHIDAVLASTRQCIAEQTARHEALEHELAQHEAQRLRKKRAARQ